MRTRIHSILCKLSIDGERHSDETNNMTHIAHMLSTDHQRRLLSAAFDMGYGHWAGVQLREISDGAASIAFRPRAEMLTAWGSLNGGVVGSLIEIPAFLALLPTLQDGELPVTNDTFLQHMRPLPGDAEYVLTGTLLRRGKVMAWMDVAVTVDGELLTTARITKTIVRGAL